MPKYCSFDGTTGERAGIHLWESEEALQAYLESDLCKTIPCAHEIFEPPGIERFWIVEVLRA